MRKNDEKMSDPKSIQDHSRKVPGPSGHQKTLFEIIWDHLAASGFFSKNHPAHQIHSISDLFSFNYQKITVLSVVITKMGIILVFREKKLGVLLKNMKNVVTA